MGTYKYVLNQEIIEGKKLIEEVVSCGDLIATYIHEVILLSESNPKGIGKLLEVLNDEHRKHILLKCQTTPRLLATGIAMYQSPNFQICQKSGMGHWNCDEP